MSSHGTNCPFFSNVPFLGRRGYNPTCLSADITQPFLGRFLTLLIQACKPRRITNSTPVWATEKIQGQPEQLRGPCLKTENYTKSWRHRSEVKCSPSMQRGLALSPSTQQLTTCLGSMSQMWSPTLRSLSSYFILLVPMLHGDPSVSMLPGYFFACFPIKTIQKQIVVVVVVETGSHTIVASACSNLYQSFWFSLQIS